MSKAYPRIEQNAHRGEIRDVVKVLDKKVNLREGSRGFLFILIIYVLRNYSDRERPRTIAEIFEIINIIFGYEAGDDVEGIGGTRLRETYLDFLTKLTGYEARISSASDDRSLKVIRRQIGGRVVLVPGNPNKYYFESDYDYRDFDILRSYIDKSNIQLGLNTFTKKDREYLLKLCDMLAPVISKDDLQDTESLGIKLSGKENEFATIAELNRAKEKAFFNVYRIIRDYMGKSVLLEIKVKNKKLTDEYGAPVQLKPSELVWDKNMLFLKGLIAGSQKYSMVRLCDITEIVGIFANKFGEQRTRLLYPVK